MQQSFTIPSTNFPGLNEIIKVAKAHPMAYSSLKKRWGELTQLYIKKAKLKPMQGPVQIHITWVEKTRRRDPDNVRAGSKFILDALVKSKVLPCDSQKTIWQISDSFLVHKENWRVDVLITEMEAV
jgi:Holliday junction resolvase RusA-like endonuclease